MHVHRSYADAPHKRTSVGTPPRAAERVVLAAAGAGAPPRPASIEPRPLAAAATTTERPVRLGECTSEHVTVGQLGGRVTEFEA